MPKPVFRKAPATPAPAPQTELHATPKGLRPVLRKPSAPSPLPSVNTTRNYLAIDGETKRWWDGTKFSLPEDAKKDAQPIPYFKLSELLNSNPDTRYVCLNDRKVTAVEVREGIEKGQSIRGTVFFSYVILTLDDGFKKKWSVDATRKKDLPEAIERFKKAVAAGACTYTATGLVSQSWTLGASGLVPENR